MAYQGISTGTIPNDGTGDTLVGVQKKSMKISLKFMLPW